MQKSYVAKRSSTQMSGNKLDRISVSKEIKAPSLNQLINSNNLKRTLWKEIKENLNI